MMLPMSLPQSCARIGAGFLSEKCVSASCRCNGHEAVARLSNQHASGVRVLPGICAETAGTTAERLDNSEAATTPVAIVADGRRCEWHIPVRATEARCAKIPAIVMVISFRHVRS